MLTYTINILFFNLLAVYTGFTRFTHTQLLSKFQDRSVYLGLHAVRGFVNPFHSNNVTLRQKVYRVNIDYTTNYNQASCIHKPTSLNVQGFRVTTYESFPEKPGLWIPKTCPKNPDRFLTGQFTINSRKINVPFTIKSVITPTNTACIHRSENYNRSMNTYYKMNRIIN